MTDAPPPEPKPESRAPSRWNERDWGKTLWRVAQLVGVGVLAFFLSRLVKGEAVPPAMRGWLIPVLAVLFMLLLAEMLRKR